MQLSVKSLLINIFARIWAFWALVIFLPGLFIAMFLLIPCFWLSEPNKAIWHRKVTQVWMYLFLHFIGCPIRIKGKEHFHSKTNYIIICNHNSLMDVPVTTPFMPRANKTIAKKEFTKIPIFGWIYAFGSVLVDRNNDASRRKSFDEMKFMLSIGLDMVIYPEGTRNRTKDPLKKFYDGAFRLAEATGTPLLPAVIFHTKKIFPANKFFYLLPHSIELHFLPQIEVGMHSTQALKEMAFTKMWDYYAKISSKEC